MILPVNDVAGREIRDVGRPVDGPQRRDVHGKNLYSLWVSIDAPKAGSLAAQKGSSEKRTKPAPKHSKKWSLK
ncbi:MAG: hypothetical protein Kow0060_20430 [Methylohalobius crimeensis]